MAATAVKHFNGRKLRVKFETAPGSGTYTETCIINTSRGIAFSGTPDEQPIPWCSNDEDLPSWIERAMDGLSASVTGAGITHSPAIDFMWEWFRQGLSVNCQIWIDVPLADGGGYWHGAFVLPNFDVTGATQKQRSEFTCSMLSDGVIDWTDAAS